MHSNDLKTAMPGGIIFFMRTYFGLSAMRQMRERAAPCSQAPLASEFVNFFTPQRVRCK
jgi:hypothetical protein